MNSKQKCLTFILKIYNFILKNYLSKAIKIVDKNFDTTNSIYREIEVNSNVASQEEEEKCDVKTHDNLIRYYGSFKEKKNMLCLVFEYGQVKYFFYKTIVSIT